MSKWIGVGGEVEVGYIRFTIEQDIKYLDGDEVYEDPKVEYKGNTFGFIGASMFISIALGQ